MSAQATILPAIIHNSQLLVSLASWDSFNVFTKDRNDILWATNHSMTTLQRDL
jgi:hypothetical protein